MYVTKTKYDRHGVAVSPRYKQSTASGSFTRRMGVAYMLQHRVTAVGNTHTLYFGGPGFEIRSGNHLYSLRCSMVFPSPTRAVSGYLHYKMSWPLPRPFHFNIHNHPSFNASSRRTDTYNNRMGKINSHL